MNAPVARSDIFAVISADVVAVVALVALSMLLVGCPATLQVPREVPVPVPVPCVDPAQLPERPPLRTEAQLFALEPYRRTHALYAEWLKLRAYAPQLEAIAEGCSQIPTARAPGHAAP